MNKDVFANRFGLQVSELVAGTTRFTEIPFYAAAFSKEAFILHKLEYSLSQAQIDLLVGAGDSISFGISTTNKLTSLGPGGSDLLDPGLIDVFHLCYNLRGAAAAFQLMEQPYIHDFTSLPGGGIIVPSRPLFAFANGESLAGTVAGEVKGYFTRVELKDAEFLELLDAYRMVS